LANDPDLHYVIISPTQAESDVKAFALRGGEVLAAPLEIVEL
jgi:hypothetical protein